MNEITMTLTEAEQMLEVAAKAVGEAQVEVGSRAANGESAERINGAVIFLAECEGSYSAIITVVKVLRYNERVLNASDKVSPVADLADNLLTGADDGWSGRGNDIKRAHFDGFRKQVARLTRGLLSRPTQTRATPDLARGAWSGVAL